MFVCLQAERFRCRASEAMACGILSSRRAAGLRIITNGEDGYLVASGDAAMMCSRIAQLHVDQRLNRTMGRRWRATAERRFSEDVAGEPFLDVWDGLLGKSEYVWRCAV